MKTAIVYDRVNKWGGAERVLLALHELFPDAPLFTSVYNKKTAQWADDFRVRPSFLQRFPHAKTAHELYALMMPVAFESFSFDEFDLVISVTSEAAKGIVTKPATKHICYCLTPTRYLWSGHTEYFKHSISQILSYPAVSYLRKWDTIAAKRPDRMIAISHEVAGRIKKYYGIDAPVVYPPVELPFSPHRVKRKKNTPFLIVSRLVSYKRIDLAITACNDLKLPLVIIGEGGEENNLKKIAGPTIQFLGKLTDQEVTTYYESSQAFLFPGREDFGIAAVEAQLAGIPVIAFDKGASSETILDGKTGVFFESQTKKAVKEAIQRYMTMTFDSARIQTHAGKFRKQAFKNAFLEVLKDEYDTIKL